MDEIKQSAEKTLVVASGRAHPELAQEIADELEEGTFIETDPSDDALLKEDMVPDFNYNSRPADKHARSGSEEKEE